MIIDTLFSAWAMSFSGHDGGNPQAKLWFCAIEPGAKWDCDSKPSLSPVRELPSLSVPPADTGLNLNMLKLYAAMRGKTEIAKEKAVEFAGQKGFCEASGDVLKLNLFPVPFQNANSPWTRCHEELSGIPSKDLYHIWCVENRFPSIAKLMQPVQPKLIVCCGRQYLHHFLLAFEATLEAAAETTVEMIANKPLVWLRLRDSPTILAIVPFLANRHGLASHVEIRAFGARLRELESAAR
jgi:hypothetical protein